MHVELPCIFEYARSKNAASRTAVPTFINVVLHGWENSAMTKKRSLYHARRRKEKQKMNAAFHFTFLAVLPDLIQ